MVIGITGGVGCGKSTVMSIMQEKYNFILLEADKIAHKLMEPGQQVYNEIVNVFGKDILDVDSSIDRKKLGEIVFSNEEKLKKLDDIVHPGVREYIENRINQSISEENFLIESAILVEAGYKNICDEIWYIYASDEVRRDRLKKSRGYTDEKIDSIINNQSSEEEFIKNADKIIKNDKNIENTTLQIEKIVEF
ncbi:MAG: dephospho-CoA kinase [Lachnospiraceae bacterium]|nr:dephospho-CoA kinase [Lachnospiraceae bacterium]